MALNYETRQTYYYFDKWLLALIKGDKKSYENCVGETVLFWLCNGRLKELETALDKCLWLNSGKFGLKRHPEYPEKTSRDHWSYFTIYKYLRRTPEGVPYRESFNIYVRMMPLMRGLIFWTHALRGKRWAERWYYRIQIPGAYLALVVYKLIYWIGNLGPEWSRNRWALEGTDRQKKITWWQEKARDLIMWLVPPFALHGKCWQLFVMKDCRSLKHLKRVLLRRAGCNPMTRLLLDDKTVTQQEIRDYHSMSGWPPGVNMDLTTDRYHYYLNREETQFNNLETDLLNWLWIRKRY